jgi:precorrin-6B methylase 2
MDSGFKATNKVIATLKSIKKDPSIIFRGGVEPEAQAIRRVFDAIADNGALVPALWRLEVANILTMAVRKRRIDPDFRRAGLADLALLEISTDQLTDSYAWTDTRSTTR